MILLKNCRDLLTIKEDAEDLIGLKHNLSVLISEDKIKKIGDFNKLIEDLDENNLEIIDCSDKVVLPGYVDSHTHLIYGESRVDEYVASLTLTPEQTKKVVQKIGLEASIYYTRNATDEELIDTSLIKLNRMLKSGTTTVEIKSGYGIDKETEIRLLRAIKELKSLAKQNIYATYLGAHYFDLNLGKEKYIEFMINEVMPLIEKEKLAEFCDIWCDDGYYTAEDSYKVLSAAQERGMKPSMHTECYSAIGGAKVAARLHAANVGHLNYISEVDIKLLKESNVVGVLLPGTDFSVKHKKPFNARPMIDAGLDIALATNLNPGNWIESMQLTMALACRNHKMSEKEAIRAATLGGAKALCIEDKVGSIEEGKIADIQIVKSDNYKNCVYKIGVNEVDKVLVSGKIVVDNNL